MNQGINCDVNECIHQDGTNNCNLKDIQVSNTSSNVEEKNDTGCMSFEKENR